MQVQTRITGANAKPNGWYEFELEGVGKASTRDVDLATTAHSLLGQPVTIDYIDKTSDKVNPHTMRPYTNRYLNAVAPQTSPLPTNGSLPAPAPAPVVQDDRGQRMGRNNIAAAAVETLIQLSDQKPETIQRLLDGLALWSESGAPLFASFATTQTDDAIPF